MNINDFVEAARGLLRTETGVEVAKGTPAIVGATAAAMTLNHWIAVATGIYILVQVAYLLRKWYREEKDWSAGKRKKAAPK